ncbi:sodium- and chloride-dependent GABA transporter ine-like isoform X2 [Amphibalanus amphitrite]|uniref:sodium- and chloride-dependent GABA transporter ine-like isoform X2 n=1 Tax=Amphibalanus amphitrite TaxID=1232801 RepID=UPI001C905667|nr:sodium- and chloride-dependent GABA transporter ine-like isoform X2 [Amphibalanus amphitrite]
MQPGLGGVPPTAYYQPVPRQPLLATGHSATLAAGLAGSARLQQAVQSRLAAGTSSVHPRLQPSHPLYRRLAAADYNPAHTISYGHSDGRQLTVRRLLDWELPDLHTVRKYTSDAESDSDADSVFSVVPTHRGARGRTTWTNKVEFILACLGYAVGLGNLWRFPYLCYKSGGGAFFIPYLIMMVVCSIPLLLMELTIGQFTRQGPVGAMGRLCPLFKGAGVAPVVISFIFCTYYNVVIGWALYYLFSSFSSTLPWTTCGNSTWGCEDSPLNRSLTAAANATQGLVADDGLWSGNASAAMFANMSSALGNDSVFHTARKSAALATTPEEVFFSHRVLEISSGVSDLGTIRIPLMLTLLLAWVLVYFSIWKSIRSSGKGGASAVCRQVVYVTVIAPYLLLTAFLWRALTLEGASTGIRYLFQPHWQLLADSKVWVNALAQNFNSVGIGFGTMITFASYNKFENRTILMDTMVIILANLLTSVFAGIIVFATLGNIAMELGRPIQKVVVDGPGLVYVVYPKALASMPFPQLWSVLFFFMLLCLGLDSQFATLEVVITSLQDGYSGLVKRYLKRHELLVLVICLLSFGLGLPYVTQGGMYVFQLMDYNVTNTSLILLALFEVVTLAWVYGTERLNQDFLAMTGKRFSNYFIVCLKFLAPLLILAIWVFSLIDHEPLTYGPYDYPEWASRLGWLLVALPVLPIPVCAVLALWRAEGDTFMERLKASVQPDRRVRRDLGFEPTVDGPDYGDHPELYFEMSPIAPQIPYSAVNGDTDSK